LVDSGNLPSITLPRGITLDLVNGKIYWADELEFNPQTQRSFGALRRANLDGTMPEAIFPENIVYPLSVAVDPIAGKVYWGERFGRIRRSNLDGTDMEVLMEPVYQFIEDLAIDVARGKHWASAGVIARSNLDGSDQEILHAIRTKGIALGGTEQQADAGPDQLVNEGDLVTLDGSMRAMEREVCGCDYGGNSWTTRVEAGR
jgi:hypothetical protein